METMVSRITQSSMAIVIANELNDVGQQNQWDSMKDFPFTYDRGMKHGETRRQPTIFGPYKQACLHDNCLHVIK